MVSRLGSSDAFEIVTGGRGRAPVVLTCEHASDRVPAGWAWPAEDAWLRGTHWTHDLGAAPIVHALAERLGARAVLTRFTRLLADPNRPEDHPDLFRSVAEGRPIALNREVSPEDRARRLEQLHRPFHQALRRILVETPGDLVLAIHTFTPVYEGTRREVALGVLFDREEELARHVAGTLARGPWDTRLNEPWSGREGLIWSAGHHAEATGRRALEIEVRQDLATDPAARGEVVSAIAEAIRRVSPFPDPVDP